MSGTFHSQVPYFPIRWKSDYIIWISYTPAIHPNKSKKLTWCIAPSHNIRGKVWMKNNMWLHRKQIIVCEAIMFAGVTNPIM